MTGPHKYQTFSHAERTIGGGGTTEFNVLTYEAPEDCTVVGVHVEMAFSAEALEPAVGYEHGNVVGFGRIVINKAGHTIVQPTVVVDWDATGDSGGLNDPDVGDTWAFSPFGFSSSGTAVQPGHGTNDRIILNPKTQRKLRRGDQLLVRTFYTNSGANDVVFQEMVTGIAFILT